jgi:hypothetical protein
VSPPTTSGPVRRTPPAAALVAAPLGLISAVVPGVFGFVALVLSGLRFRGAESLLLLVPTGLTLAIVVGAVLLLLGRSWLALAVPAGAVAALILLGTLTGGWGGGSFGFGVLSWLVPGATAVLASLPGVRGWVAHRRRARLSTGRHTR